MTMIQYGDLGPNDCKLTLGQNGSHKSPKPCNRLVFMNLEFPKRKFQQLRLYRSQKHTIFTYGLTFK